MKCEENKSWFDAYKDSELDAETRLQVEQHLTKCPQCARTMAEDQRADALVAARLKDGGRTAALWDSIESSVAAHAREGTAVQISAHTPKNTANFGWLISFARSLRESLLPSPKPWVALAGAWAIILALNLLSRGGQTADRSGVQSLSVSQVRLALEQKRLLTAELGIALPSDSKPTTDTQRPRSDLRGTARNG